MSTLLGILHVNKKVYHTGGTTASTLQEILHVHREKYMYTESNTCTRTQGVYRTHGNTCTQRVYHTDGTTASTLQEILHVNKKVYHTDGTTASTLQEIRTTCKQESISYKS